MEISKFLTFTWKVGNSMRHYVSNYDNYENKPLLVITMDLYDTVALHRGRQDNYVQLWTWPSIQFQDLPHFTMSITDPLFCMVNQCAAIINYMIMLRKRVY